MLKHVGLIISLFVLLLFFLSIFTVSQIFLVKKNDCNVILQRIVLFLFTCIRFISFIYVHAFL